MSDLRSAAYWIGHFFTVAATIIGVYYAAIVGFEVALKINLVEADRGTYYLSESMYQELEYNIDNMDRYIDRVANEQWVFKEHIEGIKLNDYIFKSAMYSDSVFEIEPQILTQVSIYYFAVGNAITQYYNTDMKFPSKVMKVVKAETRKLKEQKTIEKLGAYNVSLAKTVSDRGVNLAQPDYQL